eukprot:328062-Chlamydomonas_euryale.AAC.6
MQEGAVACAGSLGSTTWMKRMEGWGSSDRWQRMRIEHVHRKAKERWHVHFMPAQAAAGQPLSSQAVRYSEMVLGRWVDGCVGGCVLYG